MFNETEILPLPAYRHLVDALCDPDSTHVPTILSKVTRNRQQVVEALVDLWDSEGCALAMLRRLISEEVGLTDTPEVLFRGNSIISKALDVFMRVRGKDYLAATLQPLFAEIEGDPVARELDPGRVGDEEQVSRRCFGR